MKKSILKRHKGDGKEEAVREEIVRKAVALFQRQGFHDTTVQDIVDEVGIAKATFYAYLDSKTDVLVQVYEILGREIRQAVRSILDSEGTAAEKLHALIRSHVRYMVDSRDLHAVYLQEKPAFPRKVLVKFRSDEQEFRRMVTDVFKQGNLDGSLPTVDPKIAALGLLGMDLGVVQWYRPRGGLSADEIADRFFEMLADGRRSAAPRQETLAGANTPAVE